MTPRWLRWLVGRRPPVEMPPPPPVQCPSNGHAAAEARKRAEAKLRHTISRQRDVDEVARASRRLRAEDHFGEQIEQALRRRAA